MSRVSMPSKTGDQGNGHPVLFGFAPALVYEAHPDGGGYPIGFLDRAYTTLGVTDPTAGIVLKRNLLWLLRYRDPVWQFRITRYDGTQGGNWTLRDARVIAPIGDWAAVFVFELFTDGSTEHSVEVRHNAPFAIDLDAREFDAKHEAL